jgi:lipopolysaccharide transport system ATP-binding protein
MSTTPAITVEGLGKRYRRGARAHDTFRDLLADRFGTLVRRKRLDRHASEEFWALREASFEIARGENVGFIGLNGAGKSTLLKLLARITTPTAGRARIAGRVGALLEVGTGFHGELTGRENTFLYGAILGMSKQEIRRKFDAIVDFAGIDEFIDTPVKRYSSGMYVRLAFSVAAHMEPDILLLDEVLSVGDLPFQRKCMAFAKRLQRSNATILFVSHNMFSIKTMCRRVVYLRQGRIHYDGSAEEGIALYEDDCRLSTLGWTEKRPDDWPVRVSDIAVMDEAGQPKTVFDHGERMRLRLTYETRRQLESPNFIVAFVRSDGVACCNYSTEADGVSLGDIQGEGHVELVTPPMPLIAESYTIHVLVRAKGFQEMLSAQIGSTFHVRHELYDTHFGVFHEAARWSVPGRELRGANAEIS